MQEDDWPVLPRQARELIGGQMPDLAGLPLRRMTGAGTDTVLYRLGPRLLVRFPRRPVADVEVDPLARWLPVLAPHLPLSVPLVLRRGGPGGTGGAGYPYRWTVGPWLAGRDAWVAPPRADAAIAAMAGFLAALAGLACPQDAPLRGEKDRLDLRLAGIEASIDGFAGEADKVLLRDLVAEARELPAFRGRPVWVHGDLHALNLLTRRGRVSAVIDWGGMGLGDPGTDLMVAWTLFDGPGRRALRAAMRPDPADWARGRARALAMAVLAIPYYRHSNPVFHAAMRCILARVLEDWRAGAPT